MDTQPSNTEKSGAFAVLVKIIPGVLIIIGMYIVSLYSYLLFHYLAEMFSIVIACAVFMLSWNSRHFMENDYLSFLGIAYLFVAGMDAIHTLVYPGLNIFGWSDTDLAIQLWIAARYMQSLSLLLAPFFLYRKLKVHYAFYGFILATTVSLAAIFHWHIFPACYVEGVGLTFFKKVSECIISIILFGAIVLLYQRRERIGKNIFCLMAVSILLTIASDLMLTFYENVYGFSNLIGHFLKISSFLMIYKAVIVSGLANPYDFLFRNLKQSEDTARKERDRAQGYLDIAGVIIVALNADQTVVLINKKGCEILGYKESEVVGKKWFDNFIPKKDSEKTRTAFETLISGSVEPFEYFENSILTKSNKERVIAWHNAVLRDEKGAITGTLSSGEDITDRKQQQDALKWELSVNTALSELYEHLTSSPASIEEIAKTVLEKGKIITKSDHGYISSIDPITEGSIVHTLNEMMSDQCEVETEKRNIIFSKRPEALYNGLWAHSLNTLEPFFTNFPENHSASKGLPKGHIPIKCFLSMPVLLGQKLVGQIALANNEEGYTEKDIRAIERLSQFYALAIQKGDAEESIKRAQLDLEKRVQKRTEEFFQSNLLLKKEAKAREKIAEELKKSENELKKLPSKLLQAHEDETKRIGLELHDGLAQTLSAIKVWSEAALAHLEQGAYAGTKMTLGNIFSLARGAIEEVRNIIKNLHPSIIDDLGLVATISWLCAEFEKTFKGITIEKKIDVKEDDLPDHLKIVLFRILQEALNNISKHSRANLLKISLKKTKGKIELIVKDNGVGFDAGKILSGEQSLHRGIGLTSMRDRTQLSGGSFSVFSSPVEGTIIKASWDILAI